MTRGARLATAGLATWLVAVVQAQTVPPARVAVLQAEERGAIDARDLSTLRAGIRNSDFDTAKAAIRALGRLGRPALVPDIAVALKSAVPELRAEAADAIASSLSIVARAPSSSEPASQPRATASVVAAQAALLARLAVESEPVVRAAVCEALGRIPYTEAGQVARAEAALASAPHEAVTDRIGVLRGFEALVRINGWLRAPGSLTIAALRAAVGAPAAASPSFVNPPSSSPAAPPGEARLRRLAFEGLIAAGEVDDAVIERGAGDPDPQVRRLAMRAAGAAPGSPEAAAVLRVGSRDLSSMVRMEALRAGSARERGTSTACQDLVQALDDPDMQVILAAVDLLGHCGGVPEAVALLERAASEQPTAGSPRAAYRAGRALVALSRAAPARAAGLLKSFIDSALPSQRMSAARAATTLGDQAALQRLAADSNADVARAADDGLGVAAVAPGADANRGKESEINAVDLRRFAASRARVTVRGVGSFEVALFTSEAPAAVLRFARLAQDGHYDGSILSVQPTLVGLTRPAGPDRGIWSETGSWPHVRGAIGFSPGGPETGGSGIFIDLIDNPRFDHRYAVFGQVLSGIEVLDQILDADVIERVEIVTSP